MMPHPLALSSPSDAQREASHMRSYYALLEPDSPEDLPDVLSVLSSLLEKAVLENESRCSGPRGATTIGKLTVFHGERAPSISLWDYLARIFKYANCTPTCFMAAYLYLNRLVVRNPDYVITSQNVHRILITAVMVAAKFLDDSYFNNAFYAKVGGVTTLEMNRLELEFLFKISFDLHISTSVFNECFSDFLEARRWLVAQRPVAQPIRAEHNDQSALQDGHHPPQGALVDGRHPHGALVDRHHPQAAPAEGHQFEVALVNGNHHHQAAYGAAPPPVAYHQQPYLIPMGIVPQLVRPVIVAPEVAVASSGATDGSSNGFDVNTPPRDVEEYKRPSDVSRQNSSSRKAVAT
eukprot:TRINITY_DN3965_c0_g1_i2.p1 TRINITY_DN3965_c0_g1~~TRINITY_DN3965_c0_g1_i2.p1  ORF type:complete len:350 (-),score=37.73 TRINITY_DN3965_c0_g1_i2:655-1704(-)